MALLKKAKGSAL